MVFMTPKHYSQLKILSFIYLLESAIYTVAHTTSGSVQLKLIYRYEFYCISSFFTKNLYNVNQLLKPKQGNNIQNLKNERIKTFPQDKKVTEDLETFSVQYTHFCATEDETKMFLKGELQSRKKPRILNRLHVNEKTWVQKLHGKGF